MNLRNDKINIFIQRKGAGKRYHEFRKYKNEILDEVRRDILTQSLIYDTLVEKQVIKNVLNIINQHYFK